MGGDGSKQGGGLYEELCIRIAAAEARIAALEGRADDATRRADTSEGTASTDRERIRVLEGRANVDAALIAELQAEGTVTRDHAANLEVALRTSRTIGAAIGILMSQHRVTEAEAFQMLRKASMNGNQKMRDLAEEVVFQGGLSKQDG